MNKHQLGKVISVFAMLLIIVTGCTEPDVSVSVSSIDFEKETVLVAVGSIEKLSYKVSPSGIDAGTLTWTSSDDTVATVDDGVVHALAEGTSIIKVETADGKKDQCIVSVKKMRAAVMEDANGIRVIKGHSSVLYAGQPEVPNDCLFAYSSKDVQDKASEKLIEMLIEMLDISFNTLEESRYYSEGDTFKIVCKMKLNMPDEDNPEYTPMNPICTVTSGTVNITQYSDGNWIIDGSESSGTHFMWYLNGVFPYKDVYEIKLPENVKVISSGENHKYENFLYMVEYSMNDSEFDEYKKQLGNEIVFDDDPSGIYVAWLEKGNKGYQLQKLNDDTFAIIILPLEK